MVSDDDGRESCQEILNNMKLSEGYLNLARDIEVMEPKSPEDMYKAHLIDGRASAGASVDSARKNLAATFVNAFVNAGFGQDKLMTFPSDAPVVALHEVVYIGIRNMERLVQQQVCGRV